MSTANFSRGGSQAKTLQELYCSPTLVGVLQQELKISFLTICILLSITAFLGNSLIHVALHKKSSLHPASKLLYHCLATTDLLVGLLSGPLLATYWMSVVQENWSLCRYAFYASNIIGYALCAVSLMTMTAISVDRLLALLLGLRYRLIVTLKRTRIIVATFWIVSSVVATLRYTSDYRITIKLSYTFIPSCLIISAASYIKIFRGLSRHQAQGQDHFQQQLSQPNTLNMARYRKALCSALWVQLALVICYTPFFIVTIVIVNSETFSSHLVVLRVATDVIVYFNSTLNPVLYCWKISELRQAVKQTIRQALCCPWT